MTNDWTLWHSRLHQTLRQQQLLPKGQKILIAVSGGQDSLCLAQLLLDLRLKWQWELAIAHCDHGWSTDQGIAAHVKRIATAWELPFYLKTAGELEETEVAARKWRYQSLIEIAEAQQYQYIVTGHTRSDRAETCLYNLIRGSGADGLQSLGWQRNLTAQIRLIRPLLDFTRAETGEFCQQFDLPVWLDVANQNRRYARNRIRLDLIPYLQSYFNPQVERALAQTAELLSADVQCLEAIASSVLTKSLVDGVSLERQPLQSQPLAIQRRVVRQYLNLVLPHTPNYAQISAVTNLITAPNRARTSTFPGLVWIEVQDNLITAKKSKR